jgi:hypothetical protein
MLLSACRPAQRPEFEPDTKSDERDRLRSTGPRGYLQPQPETCRLAWRTRPTKIRSCFGSSRRTIRVRPARVLDRRPLDARCLLPGGTAVRWAGSGRWSARRAGAEKAMAGAAISARTEMAARRLPDSRRCAADPGGGPGGAGALVAGGSARAQRIQPGEPGGRCRPDCCRPPPHPIPGPDRVISGVSLPLVCPTFDACVAVPAHIRCV